MIITTNIRLGSTCQHVTGSDHEGGPHHAIGAVGPGAGRVRVPAVLVQDRVVGVFLAAQQRLQRLDVADGVPQDLHLGQPLVGVGRGAALQGLEGVVDFAQASPLAHGGGLPAVRVRRLPLARLAGPQQTPARLVVSTGRAHVLVLRMPVLVRFQQAHVHKPRVQVLEEVHVIGVEAGVIVEVVRRGNGKRNIRELHLFQNNSF